MIFRIPKCANKFLLNSIVSLFLCLISQPFCFAMENLFYVLHDSRQQAIASLTQHIKSPTILIAQAYRISKDGSVAGDIDKEILDYSHKHDANLIAMVTNSRFDSDAVHLFLLNPAAQKKALDTILQACIKNHLYGAQFDFEMVLLSDQAALTKFYQAAADLLHKNKYAISFAVAPTLMEDNFDSFYIKRLYEVWQGAYDLKKLGEIADFITLMAYDQHAQGTIPGPVASIVWQEQVLKHVLKHIPAKKLSLGIPTYSGFWYMGVSPSSKRITTEYSAISYDLLSYLLKKFHPQIRWDDEDKVNFTFYQYHWLSKFIFIEDAKSFKVKMALAKKYKLHGVSVFRLGIEDPNIWGVLL